MENVARLPELDSHWSIDDVADANEALDAWHEAEAEAAQDARRRAKLRGAGG